MYEVCMVHTGIDYQVPGYTLTFRTAAPFWGQTSQISSSFVPKRDCGSKGVNINKNRRT